MEMPRARWKEGATRQPGVSGRREHGGGRGQPSRAQPRRGTRGPAALLPPRHPPPRGPAPQGKEWAVYLSCRFFFCRTSSLFPPGTEPACHSPLAHTLPPWGCSCPGWKSSNTGRGGCCPAPGVLLSRAEGRGCAWPRREETTSEECASSSAKPGAAVAGGGGGDDGDGGGAPYDAGWQTCPPHWGIPLLCKRKKKKTDQGRTCGQIFHAGQEKTGRKGASSAQWHGGCAGSQRVCDPWHASLRFQAGEFRKDPTSPPFVNFHCKQIGVGIFFFPKRQRQTLQQAAELR